MDPLNANGTLVLMQQDVRPTNCRWVFVWKDDGGSKAELVAKGFVQVPGVTNLIPGD